MRYLLMAAAATLGFASLAWAQQAPPAPPPAWGEPGTVEAMLRHARFMMTDSLFFGLVVASILVANRFFNWVLPLIGGAAGVVAVALGAALTDRYHPYFLDTPEFWAAAFLLGLGLTLVGLAVGLTVMIVAQRLGAEDYR